MATSARKLLCSRSSTLFSFSLLSSRASLPVSKPHNPARVLLGFNPFSTTSSAATSAAASKNRSVGAKETLRSMRDAALLEKLKKRAEKAVKTSKTLPETTSPAPSSKKVSCELKNAAEVSMGFGELGLSKEMMVAVEKTGMEAPSEIQSVGIPAVLKGKSLLLSSPPGSGKTLAYLLPLIQVLRRDGTLLGKPTKFRCPRAVVMLPTGEKSLEAFSMAEFFTQDVKFNPIMVSDEGQPLLLENSSEVPIDMVVGTPGGILNYLEEKNVAYSDIRYLVLDQIDNMHDSGLGPQISKFLDLLKRRTPSDDLEVQAVLVTGSVTKILEKQVNPFIQRIGRDHSGEVAAVMLEMDRAEAYHLIESLDALKDKVVDAILSLDSAAHCQEPHVDSLSSAVKN